MATTELDQRSSIAGVDEYSHGTNGSKRTNTAAWQLSPREPFQVGPAELYEPGPDEILIQCAYTALNHIDRRVAKEASFPVPYPGILGTAVSGVVVAVGCEQHTRFAVGDHVASFTAFYAKKTERDTKFGTFQAYCLSKGDLTVKIGQKTFWDSAAVIASAPLALAMVFQFLQVRRPPLLLTRATEKYTSKYSDQHSPRVLLWGATTSLGCFAVQFLRRAGYTPVCVGGTLPTHTQSQKEQDQLALQVSAADQSSLYFDYHSPEDDLVKSLVSVGPYTGGVVDFVSSNKTLNIIGRVLSEVGQEDCTVHTVLPTKLPEVTTKFVWLSSYMVDISPDGREFKQWAYGFLEHAFIDGWLEAGKLVRLNCGLAGLWDAMDKMSTGEGKVVVGLE